MKRKRKVEINLGKQVKQHAQAKVSKKSEYEGDTAIMVSTGSTLLDLAISGGRVRGGGIPCGILVEVFGPAGCGKTILLCEIAGDVQRKAGEVMFHDPESRLNKQFAQMFDLDTNKINYTVPDTIPEVFQSVRKWEPNGELINAVFADSLAALSTELEMENKEGDKMGMRRAKEFSEELRRTCRILSQKNLLMVCSNQVRQSMETYGPKYESPGGLAIGFYSSLRLRCNKPQKIIAKETIAGKLVTRVIGVETEIEVFKSSIWKPYRTAPLTILFDYGIDDVRQNLQFIKDHTKNTVYCLGEQKLDTSMEKSIKIIEKSGLENDLREQVIDLWEEIESKFESNRKPKER